MNEEIEIQLEKEIKELIEPSRAIVVYNDDHNTFEHVIKCFVKYCDHEYLQAEQCAVIIDAVGKCSVKEGIYKTLKPICEALQENGLSAVIE